MTPSMLRPQPEELSRLAKALVISIIFHLLVLGTYQTGRKLNWWQNWQSPSWLPSAKLLTQLLKKADAQKKATETETPLVFVEVTPAQMTTEAPEQAKFYSDKNSKAANPEADKETDVPKINGTQEHVVKTVDTPRVEYKPLQPVLPALPAKQELEEIKAAPVKPQAQTPGDLAMAKPPEIARSDTGQAQKPRPRQGVREALARQNPASMIPGAKMKQDGGVRTRLELSSVDARATPGGAYDAALIAAVAHRWYSLLDERDYASDSRGKVELHFTLHGDGRVTDMSVAENTAGEMLALLCEKAVLDPAPFAPFPAELRRVMGDLRNIKFTFYYE
jgi:hypothetical protein